MSDEARKLLVQAKNLDYEELCTRAFVITSEGALIDPKIPLGMRVELAYEVLQARLRKANSVSVGQLPEEPDYYDLLGLDENATQKEIEEAYKKRKASLQPDVLEKKLREQGLSESEIKKRLASAKTTLYYLEKAHKVLGDETRRDHYHEHLRYKRQDEWKDTLDRKQKKWIGKKAGPINHGENWKLLGVTPGATQLDLRTAYLVQVRKYDPERYLQQLGKDKDELTPEEIKEYNIRQERWSNINRAYAEELDEKQLKAERKQRKRSKSMETQQNIIITTTPTIPAIEPSQITINFREKVIDGTGKISFTPEETALLISEGVIPPGTTSEQLSASAEVATKHLLPLGVDAQQFSNEVDRVAKNNLITQQQEKDLQLSAWILKTLQKSNPELAYAFRKEAGIPNVSITIQPAATDSPQTAEKPNQISLQTGDNGFLKPLFDKGVDFVKEKAGKLLEKTGISVAKDAAKKIITESLKKAGKELIKQGSKIAAKAGITTVAQALGTLVPIIGNIIALIITIITDILPKILKFLTKIFRGILKFITGKEDLKSQLKEISGIAMVAFLAIGSVVPALISGGIFLTTLGLRSIASVIAGIPAFLSAVIASIVITISIPVIISIITFLFLVIFILIIINNSAFVVPFGGFERADFPAGFGQFPVECTYEKGSISFDNNGATGIAKRAWEITADLYQGFWCFWNRSPDDSEKLNQLLGGFPRDEIYYPPSYPQLFNEELFAVNPNPTRDQVSNEARNLFWCTQLAVISWKETGHEIPEYYMSNILENWFRNNGRFIDASQATSKNIPTGSIIFFYVYGGPLRTNHVAIVHHVIEKQAIVFVQANSGYKDGYLIFENDGVGVENLSWARVVGFGIP